MFKAMITTPARKPHREFVQSVLWRVFLSSDLCQSLANLRIWNVFSDFVLGGRGFVKKKPNMGHHDHFSIIFVFFSNCAPHIRKNSCTWEGAAFRKSFLNPFKLFTYEDKLNGEGKEDRLKSENDVLQQGFLLTHRAQRMLPILHGCRKQTWDLSNNWYNRIFLAKRF